MNDRLQFETPENIQVSYQSAGVGTRFIAWFVDSFLLLCASFILLFLLACIGAASDSVVRDLFEPLSRIEGPEDVAPFQMVFLGIWILVWGLGSFVYFGLSELFLRGQTIGKRISRVRVAKADGFSLDPVSILIRNIFRVVDQLPPLWIVPVLSARSQRLGDVVSGTIVVADDTRNVSEVREALGSGPAVESHFRFDGSLLKRVRRDDFDAVERILERIHDLDGAVRQALTDQVVPALAERMGTDAPESAEHIRFLEDLLAAEFRRQNRAFG